MIRTLKEILWQLLAIIVSMPWVAGLIIRYAKRTPYYPIMTMKTGELYMDRWWVFNPYGKDDEGNYLPSRFPKLPSIRVHHICLADDYDAEHDHPFDAQTIILRGHYYETRKDYGMFCEKRKPGYTGSLRIGQFHRIDIVPPGGVYTLFFTWGYNDDWGYNVDGKKIHHRQYLRGR